MITNNVQTTFIGPGGFTTMSLLFMSYLMTGFFVLEIFRSGCDESVLITYVIQCVEGGIESSRRELGRIRQ